MPGDYTTCTAMFGNGAKIATGSIHQMMFPIRKGQTRKVFMSFVAVLSIIPLACAAQRIVSGLEMALVVGTSCEETAAVSGSVFLWSEKSFGRNGKSAMRRTAMHPNPDHRRAFGLKK